MRIKALRSFAGAVTMVADEVKEVSDEIAHDLIRAGYVEPEAQEAEVVEKPATKTEPAPKKPKKKK